MPDVPPPTTGAVVELPCFSVWLVAFGFQILARNQFGKRGPLRPNALLAGKMKSLNANTSSNTESATSVKALDMLNKYGDQVVNDYLLGNLELARQLDVAPVAPDHEGGAEVMDGIARKATGRLALLPVKTQADFYADVEGQYKALIDYLNQTGQNELEPRTVDYDARELQSQVIHQGDGAGPFGESAVYGEYSVKSQGKAMTPAEIHAAMDEHLGGKTPKEHEFAIAAAAQDAFAKFYARQTEDARAGADTTRGTGLEFLRQHPIGSTFRVDINGDHYNAVVTNIRNTDRGIGNPFSMSKFQVTIAVNGGLRQVTIPATRFAGIESSRLSAYNKIEDLFKPQPVADRTTAKIVTGNLLAGYGALNGSKGSIITFTKADGTTEQGIQLPRSFNPAKELHQDYRLKTAKDLVKFLTSSQNENIEKFGVNSRDSSVRVLPSGKDGITIQVPKSRAKGGEFFLDRKLLEQTGDFVSSGNYMRATVKGTKALKAIDVLMAKRALYVLPSMTDEARTILNDPLPPPKQGPLVAKEQGEAYDAHDGPDAIRVREPESPAAPAGPGEAEAGRPAEPAGRPDELLRGSGSAVHGGRAVVRGLGIAGEIKSTGRTALVGRQVHTAADLADLAQVYRDPRFETQRMFFVKNGAIVHATGVSSRMPGEVPFVPNGTTYADYIDQLRELTQSGPDGSKTDFADGYYLLHNHPSGNPTPSPQDLSLTKQIAAAIPGFLGHVIINSGKYSVINRTARGIEHTVVTKDFGPEQLLIASKPSPVLGKTIRNGTDLAALGKAMQKPGYITMIGQGSDGKVRMVSEAPSTVLSRSYPALAAMVRRAMRLSGSRDIYLVGSSGDINSAPVRTAINSGIIADAIGESGRSMIDQGEVVLGKGFSGTASNFMAESPVDKLRGMAQNRPEFIAGRTTREYSPAQTAAMKHTGFIVEQPSLEDKAKALWKDAGKKLAQGLTDQFAPVKDISKEAYGLLRLSKGASGAFQAVLRGGQLKMDDGVYDFDASKRGGVVDRLLIPLQGEHQDFLRWVAANRAERLAGEGKENLFSESDIEALKSLDQGVAPYDYTLQHGVNKGKVTRDRTLIYPDALRTFNEFHSNILDMAEQSSLIDGDSRKLWEHEFYVPFYRVDDEDGGVRNMNIKSGVVRQQAFKMLKGGQQKLNADLLDNTLQNWAHLLDASSKNRAAEATIAAAEKMGIAQKVGSSTKNAVWYMENGEKRYSLVDDPYILTAINSLQDTGMNGPVIDAMKTMKRVLTLGVTASPFFKVRLLLRDSVTAMATSKIAVRPIRNIVDGWKLTDPHSDSYFRLLAGGGMIHFGSMMEGSEAARVEQLVRSGVEDSTILGDETKVGEFYRRYVRPAITAYADLSERAEAINRAPLYDQLVKGGMSHAEASLQSRDLMDFSRQGSFASIRFLSSVVPFFNARLQGLDKIVRGAREDPARASAVIGATALMSLGLLAMYHDDDDWKKRPDWDRDNYWWFKVGGTAFRIPKPFEIGAIATLAERSFERVFDKEMTNKRFLANIAALAGNQLSMNPVPQLVKPLLDVYANKDSFTGRQIESEHMRGLQSEYRFNSGTSMAARAGSTAANALTQPLGVSGPSPVQIDHLLQGYFGWLGTFIVQAGDTVARPLTGQPSRPAPDYLKAATGGMVTGDTRDAQSRYLDQVYEQGKVIQQAYATMQQLRKEGKTAEAVQFQKDNAADLSKYHVVERVQRAEAKINAQIHAIEESGRSPDEKRAAIRALRTQEDRIARAFSPAN